MKNKNEYYIGADEVGVGDYFGGIVTCAAYVDHEIIEKIKNLDIKDSKKLSNLSLIKIAKELIKIVPYKIQNVYPHEYNFLYNKFQNAHIIKTYAHYVCIEELKNVTNKNAIVILDQYADNNNLNKYIKMIDDSWSFKIDILTTKAEEKYECVAIASIIARYYFLKQIADLSKKYKVPLPLGYNKQILEKTLNTLKQKLGERFNEEKNNLIKLHFKY